MQEVNYKTYTIKYVYAGINQYADFKEVGGKIIFPSFYPSWAKSEDVPDVSCLESIDEILKVIKSFSYNRRAEIYLIDGMLATYYSNKGAQTLVSDTKSEYEAFLNKSNGGTQE